MRDFENAGRGRDPSFGPRHLEYDTTTRHFQSASIGGTDQFGIDGNNTAETVMLAPGHSCALTDHGFAQFNDLTDGTRQIYLVTFPGNGSPDCVAIIDD